MRKVQHHALACWSVPSVGGGGSSPGEAGNQPAALSQIHIRCRWNPPTASLTYSWPYWSCRLMGCRGTTAVPHDSTTNIFHRADTNDERNNCSQYGDRMTSPEVSHGCVPWDDTRTSPHTIHPCVKILASVVEATVQYGRRTRLGGPRVTSEWS